MSEALMQLVRKMLGSDCLDMGMERGEVEVRVPASRIAVVLQKLHDECATDMNQLMDLCGVDYPEREKRFEVIYNLLSLSHNTRLRLCTQVADGQSLPTATGIYPAAGWFEREAFDLYGIIFEDHPDLRRILTDDGFEGHPLRRDFPLTGFTQVRYDDLQRRVVKEPVDLDDKFRTFNTQSPWQGVTDVQKRTFGEGK